jgi:hypothetical protein
MAGTALFDRWLIDLASWNPPPAREEWVRAMRAEFETLERGRTSWALGCLGASLGWRMSANWGSLLAIAAIVVVPLYLDRWVGWPLVLWLQSRLPDHAVTALAYATNWGTLAAASGVLAAVRPRLWVVIGLGMALVKALGGLVGFILAFDRPISIIPHIHLMDAQLDVGIGAYLGYSLVGALIGRSLGGAVKRASPKPPVPPS